MTKALKHSSEFESYVRFTLESELQSNYSIGDVCSVDVEYASTVEPKMLSGIVYYVDATKLDSNRVYCVCFYDFSPVHCTLYEGYGAESIEITNELHPSRLNLTINHHEDICIPD